MSPLVHVLNQTNPLQALQSYFVNTHFNIIFPSTPRSSSWSLSVRFPHQTPAGIILYPITYPVRSKSSRTKAIKSKKEKEGGYFFCLFIQNRIH